MKNSFIIILMVLIFCLNIVFGSEGVLEEILKPDSFLLFKGNIYIGEKHQVYIYSLQNLKLIKKIGKPGEGPGEFKLGHGINSLSLDVADGKLVIGSIGKLSLYTLEGHPIEEHRIPSMQHFLPLENGFLSSTFLDGGEGYQVQGIALFDPNLKIKKILLKTNHPVGMGVKIIVPKPNYKFIVHQEKIYLSSDLDTIAITVYDLKGNRLSSINHQTDKLKIPDTYIEKLKTYYRTSPDWKDFWNYLKQHLTFPDHFPAIRDFFIDQDLIYVQTFQLKNGVIEWLVFDLKGNLKGHTRLPALNFYTDQAALHGIMGGFYYYLEENIEKEVWEINRSDIKLAN